MEERIESLSSSGKENTSPKSKYGSNHASKFEVAIEKGDYKLVSELARRELVIEDLIDGYLLMRPKFGYFKGKIRDYCLTYYGADFSRPATIKKLNITPEQFTGFLDRLRAQLELPAEVGIEQAIEGFVRLHLRLGSPDDGELEWMIIYRGAGFDRAQAARQLGITIDAFNMLIVRLKKQAHIKSRSPRTKSA